MADNTHKIKEIMPSSPAADSSLSVGDILCAINGHKLIDIFDYHYYSDDEILDLTVEREDGSTEDIHIEKELGEDLGLVFESGLLDDYRSCSNGCIFCFIDQNPKGMRDTIYFKDDDTRLSFLQGNYVTLTNMKDEEIDRIINYHLAPINISVHATDPEVRCKMLRNRFAGNILEKMRRIKDAGLPMNGQVVLCKGINDGEILEKTMRDLFEFYPELSSVSVVPSGLTKYRDSLYPLEPFNDKDSLKVIRQIEDFAAECRSKIGVGFIYASDEWYMKAGLPLPLGDSYDGYPQIENGVGMMRSFVDEFEDALSTMKKPFFPRHRRISTASGVLPGEVIDQLCAEFGERYPGFEIIHHTIINHFFGESITVTGLVTGGDLIEQLTGKDLGSELFLPSNMFRAGEEVFLDDVTKTDVEKALGIRVHILPSDGGSLVAAGLGRYKG